MAFPTSAKIRVASMVALSWACWLAAASTARAQGAALEAKVTATGGSVRLTSKLSGLTGTIRPGDRLQPGDLIETAGNGRVVLTLTDGSQVIIQANSRVVIRDFRNAPSVRELVEVLVGYVRVKIYHSGKRSNPYRVNTPLASIAVRGTAFSVEVGLTGETRVTVFEGLVEVSSQINPQQKRLLGPGRSLLVRPSGDIGLLVPGPGSELNGLGLRSSGRESIQSAVEAYPILTLNPSGAAAPITRFLAFPDQHFDSLDNPAYAGSFERSDGRLYLLTAMSRPKLVYSFLDLKTGIYTSNPGPGVSVLKLLNYSAVTQTSYFSPLQGGRTVLGGALTLARTDLRSGESVRGSAPPVSKTDLTHAGVNSLNLSFIAARRLGSREKTNIGIEVERFESRGGVESDRIQKTLLGSTATHLFESENSTHQTQITAGLTHDFGGGKVLGAHFRRSAGEHLVDRTSTSVQSYEIGLQWRGPLAGRFSYGLRAEALLTLSNFHLENYIRIDDLQAHRFLFGGGIGYAITPRTSLAFDLAGGILRGVRTEKVIDQLFDVVPPRSQITYYRFNSNYRKDFVTANLGGQSEIGSRFFFSGSLSAKYVQGFSPYNYDIYPAYPWQLTGNLGPGWRMTKYIDAQYIFSRSTVSQFNTHSITMKYVFGQGKKQGQQ